MVIDVDKIPREGLSVSRDFEFLNVDLVEENTVFLAPAHAGAVVRKIGDEIWIKGRLTARLSFVCGRCLSPYEFPVDSTFDLVYLPEELNLMKEELAEDDLGQVFYRDNQINLKEIILEHDIDRCPFPFQLRHHGEDRSDPNEVVTRARPCILPRLIAKAGRSHTANSGCGRWWQT